MVRCELPMPVFFRPQFGPFERPLRIHGFTGKPSAKPAGPKKPPPLAKKKPRRVTPTPAGAFVPCYIAIQGGTTPHTTNQTHMTVTLSPAAVSAGYTIVASYRDEGNFGGGLEDFEAVVIKAPQLLAGGFAFTVALTGTKYVDPTAPPVTNFCGNFHYEQLFTPVTPCGLVGGSVLACWTETATWSTPPDPCSGTPVAGSVTTNFGDISTTAAGITAAYGSLHPISNNNYSCFYDTTTGCLVNTNAPCGTASGKTVVDAFSLEMMVWPQEGHVVRSSSTWAADFHDLTALVSPDPALYPGIDPDFGGNQSYLWDIDFGNGLSDSTIRMALVSRAYTKFRTTQLLMLYPLTAGPPKRYDYFGTPKFRLMGSPYVGTPRIASAWDSFFNPSGPAQLFWGASPYLLQYDPGP